MWQRSAVVQACARVVQVMVRVMSFLPWQSPLNMDDSGSMCFLGG